MTRAPRHRRGRDAFDPWIDGHDARTARLARSANPYRLPDARQLWDDGWMEAHAQANLKENSVINTNDKSTEKSL